MTYSGVQDLLDWIDELGEVVDTIKHAPLDGRMIYVVLWSVGKSQGFGGCALSRAEFKELCERKPGRIRLVNTGNYRLPQSRKRS